MQPTSLILVACTLFFVSSATGTLIIYKTNPTVDPASDSLPEIFPKQFQCDQIDWSNGENLLKSIKRFVVYRKTVYMFLDTNRTISFGVPTIRNDHLGDHLVKRLAFSQPYRREIVEQPLGYLMQNWVTKEEVEDRTTYELNDNSTSKTPCPGNASLCLYKLFFNPGDIGVRKNLLRAPSQVLSQLKIEEHTKLVLLQKDSLHSSTSGHVASEIQQADYYQTELQLKKYRETNESTYEIEQKRSYKLPLSVSFAALYHSFELAKSDDKFYLYEIHPKARFSVHQFRLKNLEKLTSMTMDLREFFGCSTPLKHLEDGKRFEVRFTS